MAYTLTERQFTNLYFHSVPYNVQKSYLLLPCPEHHIRIPGKTYSSEEKLSRNPFPFLKLNIIIRNDMSKQDFDVRDCKESSRTDNE